MSVIHSIDASLIRLLDAAFLAGMIGCVFVLVLTFLEDMKTLFHP